MSIDEHGRQATAALREHRPPIEIPDPTGVAGAWHHRQTRRRVASTSAAAAVLIVMSLVVWQLQRPANDSTPVKVGGPVPTAPSPSTVRTTVPTTSTTPHTLPPVPAVLGGKPFTFRNMTFQIPTDWQGFEMAGTAYIGWVGSSGPDLMFLRVQAGYTGSIDGVAPTSCVGRSDWNPPATTVVVTASGFRPVGNKTAQYRDWSVHCDAVNGPGNHVSPTPQDQQLRAWLLPTSGILIVEQVPPFNTTCSNCPVTDITLAVVTRAIVH